MQLPPDNQSVLYEVSLEADAEIAGPFDTWLRDHIADMLQFDGFRSAEILDDPAAPLGRIRRVVFDSAGVVVDAGRLRRLFDGAMRDLMRLHSPTCIFPGCNRPATWCQIDFSKR